MVDLAEVGQVGGQAAEAVAEADSRHHRSMMEKIYQQHWGS